MDLEHDGDLNKTALPLDWGGLPLSDYSTTSRGVTVHFRDLDKALIGYINKTSTVVGCVAWLTHIGILNALSRRDGVSLLVQKEDFLRPDSGGGPTKEKLRKAYAKLHGLPRAAFDAEYDEKLGYSYLAHPAMQAGPRERPDLDAMHVIDSVRCVGVRNGSQAIATPRMHHKFLVFCRWMRLNKEDPVAVLAPHAVWTGSFNFTNNGMRSLENAVVIRNPDIANAYMCEYLQLAMIAEPLDWHSQWVSPEWRIGT